MRFCVIQLTQNCEKYYKFEFPIIFNAFRTALGSRVEWFFLENDSVDRTAFMAAKYGHVLSLSLIPVVALTSRCTNRTARLAYLRNTALEWVAQFGPFDYTVWLDTNVYCSANTIQKLFKTISSDETIGLAGANTLETGRKCHYYDTYALNTTTCLWKECDVCEGPFPKTDTVDVPSAFGGLCFVRKNALSTFAATHNCCEHVYMCSKIWEKGYRVVVVGTAGALWKM